jgi:hypothetical protein
MMRIFRSNIWLALIYATFVVAAARELHQRLRFHDVQHWPSVSARIVSAGGGPVTVRNDWWSAPRTGQFDASYVEFEYEVDGRTYRGDRGTPNGGGLPMNVFNEPWRAFYKPTSHDVAVLARIPYRAGGWLLATLVTGIIVTTHLGFSMPGWLDRLRHHRTPDPRRLR